ncbi:protein lin-37 homolog [Diadema antillarum]|uniref:protein lin-37 homolog n=1 Tax=Diadema antillarum TaxID=105358 RepID=UPI003A8661A5
MSTPIKIKQETTEVTDARVKLEGVLQNLVDRAESFSHDSDVVVKEEQDLDRAFDDDIRELESTPTKKSPSKSRKRRKRDYANSDIEQLDDGLRAQNSYVMKLFDRSVDLAQFKTNAPLYPVCRAWMANSTSAKVPRKEQSPSPEPLPDQDMSENGLVYRLPSPNQTIDEMREELSRDPRIPPVTPHPDEPLDINADSSQAPSKETLLNGHIQRWKDIRNDWKTASQLNQSRYSESYAILKAMFERQ